MLKTKKGVSLGQAPAAVLLLVIIGVTAVIGVQINEQLAAQEPDGEDGGYINASAANATLGILQITGNLDLLGLIIIMGIVITILIASFGGFLGGRGGGGL